MASGAGRGGVPFGAQASQFDLELLHALSMAATLSKGRNGRAMLARAQSTPPLPLPLATAADLACARAMALSLAFHIVFAAVGVALPALMVIAEWRWRRTGDAVYRELAKRWAKGTAILFAVGAVSGTVLSFELGLLWPRFMSFSGAIIGMPFSLEGFAFFTEPIFLGIYLYGWERTSPRLHLASGVVVAASGAFSAFFVVLANAWMNAPSGFRLVDGQPVDVNLAAMFSPAGRRKSFMCSSRATTAAAMAAVHAAFLLRDSCRWRLAWRPAARPSSSKA